MRNTFLVCYDICDDKRLKTVKRRTLSGDGAARPYSALVRARPD